MTPPAHASSQEHKTWPVERFYWSVLEEPGWSREGVPPPGVRQRLDDELPVPAETLHAVCAPLLDGRLLVCAGKRDEIAGLGALSLTPAEIPGFAGSGEGARLNLLVGEFEPAPIRRARVRTHVVMAAAILACGMLVSVGLARRAALWEREAISLGAQTELLEPPAGEPSLEEQLAVAQQAIAIATPAEPAADSALVLKAVLAGWPATVPVTAQSISVDRWGASVSVAVEGDPEPFLTALRPPPGWRLDEPRLVNVGLVTRVTVRLRPIELAEGGNGT